MATAGWPHQQHDPMALAHLDPYGRSAGTASALWPSVDPVWGPQGAAAPPAAGSPWPGDRAAWAELEYRQAQAAAAAAQAQAQAQLSHQAHAHLAAQHLAHLQHQQAIQQHLAAGLAADAVHRQRLEQHAALERQRAAAIAATPQLDPAVWEAYVAAYGGDVTLAAAAVAAATRQQQMQHLAAQAGHHETLQPGALATSGLSAQPASLQIGGIQATTPVDGTTFSTASASAVPHTFEPPKDMGEILVGDFVEVRFKFLLAREAVAKVAKPPWMKIRTVHASEVEHLDEVCSPAKDTIAEQEARRAQMSSPAQTPQLSQGATASPGAFLLKLVKDGETDGPEKSGGKGKAAGKTGKAPAPTKELDAASLDLMRQLNVVAPQKDTVDVSNVAGAAAGNALLQQLQAPKKGYFDGAAEGNALLRQLQADPAPAQAEWRPPDSWAAKLLAPPKNPPSPEKQQLAPSVAMALGQSGSSNSGGAAEKSGRRSTGGKGKGSHGPVAGSW